MKFVLSLLIILCTCSCSTLASLENESNHFGYENNVYAGTINDLSGIPCLFGNEPGWGIIALGELPFCLVADTILLPYTIYIDCQ